MKSKWTRALSLLLCLSMLLSTGAIVYADSTPINGSCGDNLTWALEDGTLTISGTGDMYDYNIESMSVTIGVPSTNNGTKHVSRGDAPWSNEAENIQAVVIEEGVTSIGANTFKNFSNLISVTIPEGMTSIGSSAFRNCTSLTDLVIPEGVTSIGSLAFADCSNLASVVIPSSMENIETWAFYNCESLTDVYYSGTEWRRERFMDTMSEFTNEYLANAEWHYEYSDEDK